MTQLPWRTLLTALCLAAALVLIIGVFLPRDTWREDLLRSRIWGVQDDVDLYFTRTLMAGWALVICGWVAYFRPHNFPLRLLSPWARERVTNVLLFVLILLTVLMVARPFIVFRDLVRVVSPKTPFSDWGQFLGRIWTVPQESQTARDVFNALFLGFSGAIALFMYILRSKGLQPALGSHFPRTLWVLLASGFIWAAIDEVQMIHEFLGPNLPLLRSTRITKYPDDIIIFAYLAAAIVVFLRYFRFLIARKEPFLLLAFGAILQGLAAVNGLPGIELSEESYEFYGGLCYMTAILWYASREIEESLSHN